MSEKKNAGLFDIRNIIGALMLIYGVILTTMGLVGDSDTVVPPPSGVEDVNANLWGGICLLVVGIFFVLWCWLRPVITTVDDPTH